MGHFILSQGKGGADTGKDDAEEKSSASIKVRHIMLQKFTAPFARDLKVSSPALIKNTIDRSMSGRS